MNVLALVLASMLLTTVGLAVVAFAAFTHRGLPVPGPAQINDRMTRWSEHVTERVGGPLENTAINGALISSGVLMTPEKDLAGRHWFIRAEHRAINALPARMRDWLMARLPDSHRIDSSTDLLSRSAEPSTA